MQRRDDRRRSDHAAAAVAYVLRVRQFAEQGDALDLVQVEREQRAAGDRVILEQDHRFLSRLTGQSAVGVADDSVWAVALRLANLGEAQLLAQDAQHRLVDCLGRHAAGQHEFLEVLVIVLPEGHLEVQPTVGGGFGLAHGQEKVRDDKACEAPFVFQDVAQQVRVLAAVGAVHLVVGAHHRRRTFVHAALEVRQIDLAEGPFVDAHIHVKARIFHAVESEMFDAPHDVPLHAAEQRCAQRTEQHGVFAVRFLGAAPRRVAQQVDAHAAEEVRPLRPRLDADRVAHALLQIDIPGRPARHRHRKAGRVIHHHPAWAVGEANAGDAEACVLAAHDGLGIVGARHRQHTGEDRVVARHLCDLLIQAELRQQGVRFGVDGIGRQRLRRLQGAPVQHFGRLHASLTPVDRCRRHVPWSGSACSSTVPDSMVAGNACQSGKGLTRANCPDPHLTDNSFSNIIVP